MLSNRSIVTRIIIFIKDVIFFLALERDERKKKKKEERERERERERNIKRLKKRVAGKLGSTKQARSRTRRRFVASLPETIPVFSSTLRFPFLFSFLSFFLFFFHSPPLRLL